MTFKIVDLTHEIDEEIPIFPYDPPLRIERVRDMERDGFNLNYINIGEHTGTHIGVPFHFLEDGFTSSQIPDELIFLKGAKIDISKKAELNRNYLMNVCDVVM